MDKINLIFFVFFFICSGLISQNNDWTQPIYPFLKGKVSKVDGNIRYTVDSTMSDLQREDIIKLVKTNIAQNLELINESELNDSVHIVLARDRDEMAEYVGGRIIGASMLKDQYVPENMIFCIYGTKHDALKHELMHMISGLKWGGIETNNGRANWLEEGLAVFADPGAENCDGHTIEERYVYFLQNNRLLDLDSLFTSTRTNVDYKISYSQAGYVTSRLISDYGVDKLKLLWQSDVREFEKIYEIKLEDYICKIHSELNHKYPNSIDIHEKKAYENCID